MSIVINKNEAGHKIARNGQVDLGMVILHANHHLL